MFKALRDFVTLNRESLVTTVGKLLDNAALVELDDADGLLPVVDRANSSAIEFSFQGCLLLLDNFMGQLDRLVVCSIDAIPDETVHIFACHFNISVDFFDGLLALLALFVASVDQ